MTEYEDSAFMADLLLGTGCIAPSEQRILAQDLGDQRETIEKLEHIVDRLRAQTIHIVAANRNAARRYQGFFA